MTLARGGAALVLLLGTTTTATALDPVKALTQFGHDAWQAEEGLPQNTVYAIAQTPDGYLWLGTAEGLVRFDGVRFTVFDRRNTPEITNNVVFALRPDASGALWIGTEGGVLRLKDGAFASFADHDGLGERVTTLFVDSHGATWVGTAESGVVRMEGMRVTRLRARDGLSSDLVTSIVEAGDGSLWIGTRSGGLNRWKDGAFARGLRTSDGLSSDFVTALAVDDSGVLWVGTDAGIDVLRAGGIEHLTLREGLGSQNVTRLLADRQGSLWAGTTDAGVHRIRGRAVSRFASAQGLSNDDVWALAEDAEGSLWIGTFGGGLNRLRDGSFTPYGTPEGLKSDSIRALAEDRNGGIWIGSEGGGLSQLREGKVKATWTRKEGLPDDRIYSIVNDGDGSLLIGGYSRGLARLRGGTLAEYAPADPRVLNGVHTILRPDAGALWLGTFRHGLFKLTLSSGAGAGGLVPFTKREGLASDSILALLQDRKGTLWIGTAGGGLSRLEKGQLRRLGGLRSNFVYALYEDGGGALWIGTFGGGLVRLKDERPFVFTTAHGLFDDVIYGILEDDSGALWLTCNRGIFRIPRADLEAVAEGRRQAVSSAVFGLPDGMRSVECNSGGQPALKARDGRLWFATVKGAVMVDPARLLRNEVRPPVHVEEVLVDGRAVDPRRPVPLEAGKKSLEFRYTANSLRAPSRVRFRYRLEGLEKEWTDAGARRVAYYNRVPHGAYRFRVMASNDDGLWNEAGPGVALFIPPHYWETRLFYGLVAVGVGLCILAAHRARVRHMKARESQLVRLVEERTTELQLSEARALEAREAAVRASQAKSAFLARMSHELRTPLNVILGFAQLMRQDGKRSDDDREHLTLINKSGEHLLRLINDVLSLARIEAGHLSLDERPFALGALLQELEEMFRLPAQKKGLTLALELAPGIPAIVRGDEGKLRQILINLLGNAVKFTAAGEVVLRAEWADGRARLEVEDTGPGIPEEERTALFHAFSQTESGRKTGEGTGLGLAISLNFVRLMGGSLAVLAAPRGGALFRLQAPLPLAERRREAPLRSLALAPEQPRFKLLVVDDSADNRLLLRRMLEGMGFDVEEASDGALALERWASWHPDLIWMDVRMKGIDGLEATRRIREREGREGRNHTPVVALTASILDHEEGEVLAAGCDEMVPKPFKDSIIWQVLARRLGVRFVEVPSSEDAAPGPGLATAIPSLEQIPAEWRIALHSALVLGDVQAAYRVVERIRERDENAAESLRAMIKSYRFDEVLALTQSA